jgi:hypothetical protein
VLLFTAAVMGADFFFLLRFLIKAFIALRNDAVSQRDGIVPDRRSRSLDSVNGDP